MKKIFLCFLLLHFGLILGQDVKIKKGDIFVNKIVVARIQSKAFKYKLFDLSGEHEFIIEPLSCKGATMVYAKITNSKTGITNEYEIKAKSAFNYEKNV